MKLRDGLVSISNKIMMIGKCMHIKHIANIL